MKNIIKILTIGILVTIMYGCICGCGNNKYEIKTPTNSYVTNGTITKEGDCIKFTPNDSKNAITVCGSYTIIENKSYKPPKK